ncbi:MAG: hypothetical protein EBR67_10790 [Proteobacteria bacterium]|nr:hypothetical protein [Pseudomonadota bacterium]
MGLTTKLLGKNSDLTSALELGLNKPLSRANNILNRLTSTTLKLLNRAQDSDAKRSAAALTRLQKLGDTLRRTENPGLINRFYQVQADYVRDYRNELIKTRKEQERIQKQEASAQSKANAQKGLPLFEEPPGRKVRGLGSRIEERLDAVRDGVRTRRVKTGNELKKEIRRISQLQDQATELLANADPKNLDPRQRRLSQFAAASPEKLARSIIAEKRQQERQLLRSNQNFRQSLFQQDTNYYRDLVNAEAKQVQERKRIKRSVKEDPQLIRGLFEAAPASSGRRSLSDRNEEILDGIRNKVRSRRVSTFREINSEVNRIKSLQAKARSVLDQSSPLNLDGSRKQELGAFVDLDPEAEARKRIARRRRQERDFIRGGRGGGGGGPPIAVGSPGDDDYYRGLIKSEKALIRNDELLRKNSSSIESFGAKAAQSFKRYGAFVAGSFAINALVSSLNVGIQTTLEFEKTQTRLAQILDNNRGAALELSKGILQVSRSTGISSNLIGGGVLEFAQAGFKNVDQLRALSNQKASELEKPILTELGIKLAGF